MSERRTAVLVDGDNFSAKHAARVLCEAGRLGRVDIARAYVAAPQSSQWLTTPGFRLIHSGAGKNATDLLLSMDAMEMALAGGVDTFVIATSDRDFAHLAHRLRERGHHVLGLGEAKAPEDFRMACSAFRTLCVGGEAVGAAQDVSDFDQKIRCMIKEHSVKGRGMQISVLGAKMHTAHGSRISTLSEGKWRTYLEERPKLYELDPRGQEAMVRFRPCGFQPQ